MACTLLQPAVDSPLPLARPRPMTRCECSGVSFAEVARLVLSDDHPVEQVLRLTGCGQTCGGCVPDLAVYLAAAAHRGPAPTS
ncbi:MAG TPA: (2Fe-2S)-binding protein [Vicinamibacteria bacterium]|nr:(2Fe-2S)-binding protein [Vicinamibacteria bacterium]